MQERSLSRRESRKDYHIGPRLFVLIAWLPMLLFLIWLMSQIRALYTNNSAAIGNQNVLQLVVEDDQFRIYVSNEHLTTGEAEWLLQESNKMRAQLVEFLQLEDSGNKIRITVHSGYGISHITYVDSIVLFGKSWRTSLLHHELTHVLVPQSNFPFRREGIAVLAESRLAGSIMPPHPWWALDEKTAAVIETLGFPDLETLDKTGMLHVPPPSQLAARFRFYWLAGSFTGYLVDTYGWEKYWELYQDGQYEVVYGRSLTDLEQEWLAQLATYKRIRYAPLAVLGLLCVVLLAWAVRQPAPWRRALAVGAPGILAAAAAVVPAPFPVLAAILLGLLALLLGRQRMVGRWPRGVWWTAVILGTTLAIGLIIIPGWSVVLRYA